MWKPIAGLPPKSVNFFQDDTKTSGLGLVVPSYLLIVDLLKAMFTMTCYIVLQFFQNLRIFDSANIVSLVFSIASLSQRGVGQPGTRWDTSMWVAIAVRGI